MWDTAIADFDKAEAAAEGPAGKGDALTHKAFCLLRLGKKKKALKAISTACTTYKTGYACDYDDEETIDKLDMNEAVGELPNEEEELEGTGEAEDETWIPVQALLRPEKFEKGAKVTVDNLEKLRTAWEAYDEWSEDYVWQADQSAFITDMEYVHTHPHHKLSRDVSERLLVIAARRTAPCCSSSWRTRRRS